MRTGFDLLESGKTKRSFTLLNNSLKEWLQQAEFTYPNITTNMFLEKKFKTSLNIHSSGSHSLLYKLIVLGNQIFCMCQGDLKKPQQIKANIQQHYVKTDFQDRDNEISLYRIFVRLSIIFLCCIQHRNCLYNPTGLSSLPVSAVLFPLQRCETWAQRKLFLWNQTWHLTAEPEISKPCGLFNDLYHKIVTVLCTSLKMRHWNHLNSLGF